MCLLRNITWFNGIWFFYTFVCVKCNPSTICHKTSFESGVLHQYSAAFLVGENVCFLRISLFFYQWRTFIYVIFPYNKSDTRICHSRGRMNFMLP